MAEGWDTKRLSGGGGAAVSPAGEVRATEGVGGRELESWGGR